MLNAHLPYPNCLDSVRFLFSIIGFVLLISVDPAVVQAQAIRLGLVETPLEKALEELREDAGIDIVFAQRLVSDKSVSCSYEGESIDDAFICLLDGTGLHAERVRRRQYVIVAVDSAQGGKSPVTRGTLNGFVIDSETGDVLPGAHVYLPSLQVGSVTNLAGYFAIPSIPLGEYLVRVSFVGFHSIDSTLTVNAGVPVLSLKPTALTTDSILVEEQRSDFSDASSIPGILRLPASELEHFPSIPGEQDLFQALQWFPGVQRTGEINGGLHVRGGEPDQNLFLLDGAPIYHPWHAFSLVSTYQTETFRDVRLYRGSMPAEHGGRLVSVLDTRMKDGNRPSPRATVGLGLLNARTVIESPITSKSSFMLAGRRSYLDKLIGREHPVEDNTGRRDTLRTGYYFYDVSAKVAWYPNQKHRLSLSHYRGWDDLDLRLPFDLSLDLSSWLHPADLFFEIDQSWGNEVYTLKYEYLHSPRVFLTSTAYHSLYRASEGAFIHPTSSASVESDYSVRLGDFGVKLDVDYYRSLTHQVRAGVQVVDRRFRSDLDATILLSPGSIDSLDQTSQLHEVEIVSYVQDVWRPSARWNIQPGLRASVFSGGSYYSINPRLHAQYAVMPQYLFIRGGVGTQVQYVHRLRDRYSFLYDLVSSRWIPASSDVRPSRSIQFELGAETLPASWFSLAADVYYRNSNNILLAMDEFRTKDGLEGPGIEVGALLGQYTPGKGRAYGVELTGRINSGPWQFWLNYSGGRSLNQAPELGEMNYHAGRYDIPRSFRGMVNYKFGDWTITLAGEARSGYPNSVPVARYMVGDPIDGKPVPYLYRPYVNNGRLPPYYRLDTSLTYRFRLMGAKWQAQIQVYNVTNRRNVIARHYDPNRDPILPEDRRGLPIIPLFDITMDL